MQEAGQTPVPGRGAGPSAGADAGATADAGVTEPGAPGGSSRGPGDLLVQAGVVLFGIGVAAVVVVVALFLVTGGEVPLVLSLGAALGPAGLGLALLGLLRQGRAASREARRRRAERRPSARDQG